MLSLALLMNVLAAILMVGRHRESIRRFHAQVS